MAENKAIPTGVLVSDFLATVSEQRQEEAQVIIAMMNRIAGLKPVMWGASIIGFGIMHYKSEAGREGDMPILGFSPRKTALTIYFEGFNNYGEELEKLGKYKASVGCLYINKLSDIDEEVLFKMLKKSYEATQKPVKKDLTVEAYIASVPEIARPKLDELRAIVRSVAPNAKEVVSYGILGYKVDEKRARVFVSGWKDHVAVYPVPKSPELQAELAKYQKGKGTLWFSLTEPLPKALIEKIVRALVI